jgi:hypothetical protein
MGLIVLQNITFSKKHFNFGIFLEDSSKEDDKKEEKKNFYLELSEILLKHNNINIKGNFEFMTNQDNYREVIKEKTSIENNFRNEYFNLY